MNLTGRKKMVMLYITAFLMILITASAASANSFTVDEHTLANETSENIILGSGGSGLVVGHGSANAGPDGTSAGVGLVTAKLSCTAKLLCYVYS